MITNRGEGKTTEVTYHLRCAESQLQNIVAMIEGGADCRGMILQIWVVQGTLREVNRLIVTHYLTVCLRELLANADKDPAAYEHCLAEVMSLYQLFGDPIHH